MILELFDVVWKDGVVLQSYVWHRQEDKGRMVYVVLQSYIPHCQ